MVNAGFQYYQTGCIDFFQVGVAAALGAAGGGFGSYLSSAGLSIADQVGLNTAFGWSTGAVGGLATGGDPWTTGFSGALGGGLGSIYGIGASSIGASTAIQATMEAAGLVAGAAIGETGSMFGNPSNNPYGSDSSGQKWCSCGTK